jgi:hypothetical protein
MRRRQVGVVRRGAARGIWRAKHVTKQLGEGNLLLHVDRFGSSRFSYAGLGWLTAEDRTGVRHQCERSRSLPTVRDDDRSWHLGQADRCAREHVRVLEYGHAYRCIV